MTLSVEAQGSVLIARDNRRLTPLKVRAAAKRGTIRVFSGASRRRLIELMARLRVTGVRTTFLTLTFNGVPTPQEAKQAFKRFTMRLRRRYPAASALWRMEYQDRGAIHFHLLIFNMPYWSHRQIQYAWECCTGELMSIVHVKLLHGGKKQAMAYVAKYIAKASKAVGSAYLDNAAYSHAPSGDPLDPGRFWGWINRPGLPYDVRRLVIVGDEHMIAALWREMAELSHGLAAQQPRAARFYGTCCYDLAEAVSHNAGNVIYDEISINSSSKLHLYR